MQIQPITINFNKIDTGVINTNFFRIHYYNHYLTYISNTNKFLINNLWTNNVKSLEELISTARPNHYLYNNAAQIWNHEFFFTQFSNNPQNKIGLKLEHLIHNSVDKFIEECIIAGIRHFGSGYLWIYLDQDRSLIIDTSDNAKNLVKMKNCIPILCIDLWEHSYYLSHGSNRKQYLIDLFETAIDWNIIENRIKI